MTDIEDSNWEQVKCYMYQVEWEKRFLSLKNKKGFMPKPKQIKSFFDNKQVQETIKRLKAFAWSGGMMLLAGLIDIIVQQLTSSDMDNSYTVVIGLVLAQISKYISNRYKK